ncbi:MAG: HAD-IC family P-type ATPase [Candidatus Paceibacterota bacterium]
MEKIENPWALSSEEIFNILKTKEEGLTEKEVEERIKKYGRNTFHNNEKRNPLLLFLEQFLSPLIFLLIGASIITSFLNEWINTGVILFAIILNAVLGFYHEYHAENTIEKLKTYIKDRVRVIRNGREEEIDSSLLVPGDIIKLSYGFRVPADARIISENNFSTDEAILTGESIPVEKSTENVALSSPVADRKNIAHSGTLVVEGYAKAIVFATGNNTEIGKIASIVLATNRVETPLKRGINHLAWLIFYISIVIVIGIILLGLWRGESLLPMLVLSAAVAVGAVPEALPITLTVILSIGATLIANKKGIVRQLSAAETLGSTTLIMTDKTGTLTMADMQLLGIYGKKELLLSKEHIEDHKTFSKEQKEIISLTLFNLDISIENQDEEKSKWTFKGKPFEVNIAKACMKNDIPLDPVSSLSSYLVLPFNSTNKFSVSTYEDKYIIMGAPDILLKRSNVKKEDYIKIESWIEKTSESGKRLIAVATLPKRNEERNITREEIIDIDFKGMLVFYDAIRHEVPDAIKKIESHGVKMVLITGDLKGTAISLVKSIGWNVSDKEVLTGSDLKGMKDEEILSVLPKIKIFARVTPEDKLRIGKLYQGLGEIVAMTGDGVNDAPALKAMDIGISLGSSSDVAKTAADLVLLDDNFNTISTSIDEGRKILSNIRKAIVYLMSSSLDEIFVIGGSLIIGLPLPITALQIIWVNLFTGSLPAFAYAFDDNFDSEKYKGKNLKLIFSKEVKILTLGVGLSSSILLFILHYFLTKLGLDPKVASSIFFVCFSTYILAVAFSFRSLHNSILSYNIFSNKKLNWGVGIAWIILLFTITVPFMRDIFGLAPFPIKWIPFVLLWLLVNILIVEITKCFFRTKIFSREKKGCF